jgi:hypothetical protein
VKVSTSPDFLQSVMDAVWQWVAQDDEERVPLAPFFDRLVCLEWPEGGFVFFPKGNDVWEVHTLFLPGAKDALSCAKEAAAFMFAGPCQRIVTKVPVDNIPADRLTRKMGFTLTHTEPGAFLRGGVRHNVNHYALSKDAWEQAMEGR